MLDKYAQQVESAATDRYRGQSATLVTPEQAAPIELESLEQEDLTAAERVYASGPPVPQA